MLCNLWGAIYGVRPMGCTRCGAIYVVQIVGCYLRVAIYGVQAMQCIMRCSLGGATYGVQSFLAMEREMAATQPKPKPLEKAPQPFMLYVFFDCETIYTDTNSVDVLCDMCICVVGKTVCVLYLCFPDCVTSSAASMKLS